LAASTAAARLGKPPALSLVLLGAGHAHVEVLRSLRDWPPALKNRVRVTVVAREVLAPYSGMLPGVVAGAYAPADALIDARALAARASSSSSSGAEGSSSPSFCEVLQAEARAIDVHGRRVLVESGSDQPGWLPFDVLSVNVGAAPSSASFGGGERAEAAAGAAAGLVTPVKPVDAFLRRWEQGVLPRARAWLDARAAAAAGQAPSSSPDAPLPFRVAVVGGGAGGVELAFAVAQRLASEWRQAWARQDRVQPPPVPPVQVTLYARGRILPDAPASARRAVLRLASGAGVSVAEGCEVAADGGEPGRLRLLQNGDGTEERSAPFDACLWCTQASAPAWFAGPESRGLELDDRGFLRVRPTLQLSPPPSSSSSASSCPSDDVFAAGDAASIDSHPRPKAGVYAVRSGPILAENLRRRVGYLADVRRSSSSETPPPPEPPLLPYLPQRAALALVSLGAGQAMAVRAPFCSPPGACAWRWKDRIDRAFVDKYRV
jgi:selenide,water dikinase